MGYEFEEAEADRGNAIKGVATLGIGLVGLICKCVYDGNVANNREAIQREISYKQSRINDLNAKWFPSAEQKQELARLNREVAELKRKL